MTTSWPDPEGALRTWLRTRPAVQALAAQRVFFGIPKPNPTWPLVVIARIGGGNGPGDAPVDEPLIQIDCWGDLHPNGNGNKAQALALANAVRAELLDLADDTELVTGVRAAITAVDVVWLPDPDDDRPRYALTVSGSFVAV